MTRFRCIPIPTETAERFRTSGRDDNGNALRRFPDLTEGSYPCRHCLRLAHPGEAVLLGSYNLPHPAGIYWTPSPIFVHADGCPAATGEGLAEIVRRNGLVSIRAYDAQDQVIYPLGHVCDGAEAEAPLVRALDDRRTAYVNIHTARPGCLLTRVERVT